MRKQNHYLTPDTNGTVPARSCHCGMAPLTCVKPSALPISQVFQDMCNVFKMEKETFLPSLCTDDSPNKTKEVKLSLFKAHTLSQPPLPGIDYQTATWIDLSSWEHVPCFHLAVHYHVLEIDNCAPHARAEGLLMMKVINNPGKHFGSPEAHCHWAGDTWIYY